MFIFDPWAFENEKNEIKFQKKGKGKERYSNKYKNDPPDH